MPVGTIPRRARAVVVGAGIAGCSVAYHLKGARGFPYLYGSHGLAQPLRGGVTTVHALEASFCVENLAQALERGKPEVLNTDQGTLPTSSNGLRGEGLRQNPRSHRRRKRRDPRFLRFVVDCRRKWDSGRPRWGQAGASLRACLISPPCLTLAVRHPSSVIRHPRPRSGIHGGASSPFSRGFTREWRGRASLLRQAPPGHPGFVGLVLPEIWNATALMKSYLSDKCKLSVSQSTQHVS